MRRRGISIASSCPEESTKPLKNPERGFYSIFRHALSGGPDAAARAVEDIYTDDDEDLLLTEISLGAYRSGALSREALLEAEALFAALKDRGGSYLIRFLYDWDGKARFLEPDSLPLIFRHMEQLGPLIRDFSGRILSLQGLFTGNWGEMHGSRYGMEEDVMRLYGALRRAAGPEVFLSVRTPSQERLLSAGKDKRIGLFNDGIFGSVSDLGTYRDPEADPEELRERELSFQETLCKNVPNGGEVLDGSGYRDFPKAMEELSRMRVSYLNRHHDSALLEKWQRETVTKEGAWKGMDGLSFLGAHMGYRYVLCGVKITRTPFFRRIRVTAGLRNIGFAPLYHDAELILTAAGPGGERTFLFPDSVRELPGGRESGKRLVTSLTFPEAELPAGDCTLWIRLHSRKYQQMILFGNRDPEEKGYRIGRITRQ